MRHSSVALVGSGVGFGVVIAGVGVGVGDTSPLLLHQPRTEHKKSPPVLPPDVPEFGLGVGCGARVFLSVGLLVGVAGIVAASSGQLPRNSQIESYSGGAGKVGNEVGAVEG